MNFGKYAILQPVTHNFEKEPDWNWIIKPVTTNEELALSQFLSTERVMVMSDGSRIGRPATNIDVAVREIALTFGGTNIPGEDGKPVIELGASLDQIEAVLKKMPHPMVLEIWDAIAEAIPGWGPQKVKKVVDPSKK